MISPKRLGLAVLIWLACMSLASAAPVDKAWQNFKKSYPKAQFVKDTAGAAPSMIYDFKESVGKIKGSTDRAKAFLDRHKDLFAIANINDLVVLKEKSLRSGKVVHFEQRYQGVPVYNAQMVVHLDANGDITMVHNQYRPIANLNSVPTIAPQEAIAEAWAMLYAVPTANLTPEQMTSKLTKLYVWHRGSVARLAYAVALPMPLLTENRVAFIDAHSGRLLQHMNRVQYERQVNVWHANPGSDLQNPATTVVDTLGVINPPENQGDPVYLTNDLLKTYNCPNKGETMNVGMGFSVPVCTPTQTAAADENGDFLFDPVFGDYGDEGVSEDKFSEVHMHFHAEKIYSYFQGIGEYLDENPPFTTLESVPLQCIVNFQVPAIFYGGSLSDLAGFDNAFFTNQSIVQNYPPAPSIVFGQGSSVDFAYDGEVVYHEFTHAVINTVANMNYDLFDEYGMKTDPSAANEGYADFFGAMYMDDPKMAEYVGNAFSDTGSLRDLTNTKKCPDDVKGEAHDDSEYWAAGLWDIRNDLVTNHGASLIDIAACMFEAILNFPSDPSYTVMSATTLEVIESYFGTDARATAEQIFNQRGVISCNRAVPTSSGSTFDYVMLSDNSSTGFTNFTPGYIQFAVTIEEPANYFRIRYYAQSSGGLFGGGEVLVNYFLRSGEPVTFEYNEDNSVTPTADQTAASALWVEGDNADEYDAVFYPTGKAGSYPAGTYYFAIGNVSSGGGGMMGSSGSVLYSQQIKAGRDDKVYCNDASNCQTCQACPEDTHLCTAIPPECEKDEDCGDGKICKTGDCGGVCENAPVDGDSTPTDGDVNPTDGDETPVDGDVNPTDGDETPVDGDTNPTDGDETPVDGDTNPTDGDEAPIDGDTNPTDGDEAPIDGDTSPTDGDAACTKDEDCGDCKTCDVGVCKPIESECAKDEDCDEDEVCMQALCGKVCQATEPADGDPVDGDSAQPDGDKSSPETPGAKDDDGCSQSSSPSALALFLLVGVAFARRRVRG